MNKTWSQYLSSYRIRPSFSTKEHVTLLKQLAFLSRAGVPLSESFTMLAAEARTSRVKKALAHIRDDVAAGRSFSESLGTTGSFFDTSIVHIIATGEATGTLGQTCAYLADLLMKRHALRQKITGAFVYPAIIAIVMLGIIGFLMLYLFPKILPIFTSLHMQLPLSTRIVIGASTFFMRWGIWCIGILCCCAVAAFIIVKQSRRIRSLLHQGYLWIPVVGMLVQNYNLISGARTLQLLTTRLPLDAALTRTAESTSHIGYQSVWHELAQAVQHGQSLAHAMRQEPKYFPSMYVQIIAAGERSGVLPETLSFLESWYENDNDERMKKISTLIEPCMMIVMGLIVGFIALSIIMPIYNITQNLHA